VNRKFNVTGIGKTSVICLLVPLLLSAGVADAARAKKRARPASAAAAKSQPKAPTRPEISTICIEAESGAVLGEENADALRPPASMVKMMLMLMVSEGLQAGKWRLETPITVTERSQGMGGTQVFLKAGEVFPLNQLMLAVAVASANDAAMAVAEGLWGSEAEYLKQMNKRAAEIGMTNSKFRSAHGLPPTKGEEPDITTARDMSKVAQILVRNPVVLSWTSTKELVFRPGEDPKQNTNKLLQQMNDCDGLKTGFINLAGFCVTATAVRNNIRLITVVMGLNQNQERFSVAKEILNGTFSSVCKHKVVAKGDSIEPVVPVRNSEVPEVRLQAAKDLTVVVKESEREKITVVADCPEYVRTPIKAGDVIGKLRAELAGKSLGEVPLIAPADVKEARWHWKLQQSIF
jgi:D-alanyl-D-alanine carboxypeptidase (penicillin-binding protein 5/6)